MTRRTRALGAFAALWACQAMTQPAMAQADMSCADYLKADAQMQSQMSAADKAALSADPSAAAMDKKMRDYCTANPRASSAEAMQKAMN